MKIQRMIARVELDAVVSCCIVVFFTGCATEPPPLPPNNAADPQVRSSSKAPRNLLAPDETTLAIQRQLSASAAYAESAEQMGHDMGNMPGMKQTSESLKENTKHTNSGARIYMCPMHPQVRSDKLGDCPICGMKLVPKKEGGHEAH